jgi:hypothetical protein
MTINGERKDITAEKPFSFGLSLETNPVPLPEPQQLTQVAEKKVEPIAISEQANVKKAASWSADP